MLDKTDTAWPTTKPKDHGYRFLGYRLTPDDRPTFAYSFSDVKVEDFPNAEDGKDIRLADLKLSAQQPIENLWFRAAVGNKIEAVEGGWFDRRLENEAGRRSVYSFVRRQKRTGRADQVH